jgi:hypothetical protein
MRTGYAHEADVALLPGADERVIGGAVTAALCGLDCTGGCHWPHHTAVRERDGGRVRIRVLFVCEPGDETAVRERIVAALTAGTLPVRPDGGEWTLAGERAVPVDPADEAHAARLAN